MQLLLLFTIYTLFVSAASKVELEKKKEEYRIRQAEIQKELAMKTKKVERGQLNKEILSEFLDLDKKDDSYVWFLLRHKDLLKKMHLFPEELEDVSDFGPQVAEEAMGEKFTRGDDEVDHEEYTRKVLSKLENISLKKFDSEMLDEYSKNVAKVKYHFPQELDMLEESFVNKEINSEDYLDLMMNLISRLPKSNEKAIEYDEPALDWDNAIVAWEKAIRSAEPYKLALGIFERHLKPKLQSVDGKARIDELTEKFKAIIKTLPGFGTGQTEKPFDEVSVLTQAPEHKNILFNAFKESMKIRNGKTATNQDIRRHIEAYAHSLSFNALRWLYRQLAVERFTVNDFNDFMNSIAQIRLSVEEPKGSQHIRYLETLKNVEKALEEGRWDDVQALLQSYVDNLEVYEKDAVSDPSLPGVSKSVVDHKSEKTGTSESPVKSVAVEPKKASVAPVKEDSQETEKPFARNENEEPFGKVSELISDFNDQSAERFVGETTDDVMPVYVPPLPTSEKPAASEAKPAKPKSVEKSIGDEANDFLNALHEKRLQRKLERDNRPETMNGKKSLQDEENQKTQEKDATVVEKQKNTTEKDEIAKLSIKEVKEKIKESETAADIKKWEIVLKNKIKSTSDFTEVEMEDAKFISMTEPFEKWLKSKKPKFQSVEQFKSIAACKKTNDNRTTYFSEGEKTIESWALKEHCCGVFKKKDKHDYSAIRKSVYFVEGIRKEIEDWCLRNSSLNLSPSFLVIGLFSLLISFQ